MTNTRPRKRRASTKKSQTRSVMPWVLLLVLIMGGIQIYEYRHEFMPKKTNAPQVANVQPKPANVPKPIMKAEIISQVTQQPSKTVTSSAITPPMPVGKPVSSKDEKVIAAAIPSDRPMLSVTNEADVAIAPSGSGVNNVTAQFAFCGRSGFKNCVMTGNSFYANGKRYILSGITVGNTESASCQSERHKGFAAKVRLRDMLNAGSFTVSKTTGGDSVVEIRRGNTNFAAELIRGGLARPNSQKNQSWCS